MSLLCQDSDQHTLMSEHRCFLTQSHAGTDISLDISRLQDHSRLGKPGQIYKPNTRDPYRSPPTRFQYSYANCPGHVLVCIKGTYDRLAYTCPFCHRQPLGLIYQCEKCGTYICGSCKESERKFKWTRGKDPEYYGK